MAHGPGKYDSICTLVREQAQAEGAIVIILNGNQGSGFSMQAPPGATASLPAILETLARQIREGLN